MRLLIENVEKYAFKISQKSEKAKLDELILEIFLEIRFPNGLNDVEIMAKKDQKIKIRITKKNIRRYPACGLT